jgi:hypothetical protein
LAFGQYAGNRVIIQPQCQSSGNVAPLERFSPGIDYFIGIVKESGKVGHD